MEKNKIDLSEAKEIQGFSDYFFFPDNRGVWSNKSNKFLASQPTKNSPYKSVHLYNEGKSQRVAIHVLVAQEFINEPFAVINADDYYGAETFEVLVQSFTKMSETDVEKNLLSQSKKP